MPDLTKATKGDVCTVDPEGDCPPKNPCVVHGCTECNCICPEPSQDPRDEFVRRAEDRAARLGEI